MSNSGIRPRPRPRPVPRATAPAASVPNAPASSAPSNGAPQTSTKPLNEFEDEDALFMRNRGRTAQDWKNLEALKVPDSDNEHTDEDESEDQCDLPSTPKRRYQNKSKREASVPLWQKTDVKSLLKSGTDEDNDDLEFLGEVSDSNQSPRKRKRERSLSRSITPPPDLPAAKIQHAKDLVRQALRGPMDIPSSPVISADDSTDTIVLDPELAKIARSIRDQESTKAGKNEVSGGPELVKVTVKWLPISEDKCTGSNIWTFKVKRHDTLHNVYTELADRTGVLANNLVVSHDGRRIFSSATPHTLKLWAEGEFEACDKKMFDYNRENRFKCPPSPTANGVEPRSPTPDAESAADSDAESTGGEKLKLVLRSANTKQVNLTVRTTATCGAIVEAFLKAAGLPAKDAPKKGKGSKSKGRKGDSNSPRLMIDGEKMDPSTEIGGADLEDGDMVEVVDL